MATTSSSAWSRLVQITRAASINSRSHSTEPPRPSTEVSSSPAHTPSPGRPAKRRRVEASSPTESSTYIPSASASRPSRTHASASRYNDAQMFYPSAGHEECTTACPCQVEDLECVAVQRRKRVRDAAPRIGLRTFWASQRDDESLTRQLHADTSNVQLEDAGLGFDEQDPTPQSLHSPTRSSDSISEADGCDFDDVPAPQLSRGTATSSIHPGDDTQERSGHDTGALFAPRRRQLLSRVDQSTHRNTPRRTPGVACDDGRHGRPGDAPIEREEGQQGRGNSSDADRPLTTAPQPCECASPRAEDAAIEAGLLSETTETCAAAGLRESSQPDDNNDELVDGDQDSINKTPKSGKWPIRSAARGDANQLITPSTSPTSRPEAQSDENNNDDAAPSGPSLVTKTKRRLNLHSSSYNSKHPQKKRKTPPKKQVAAVQTTLSLTIGGAGGMKECRVCDTVYNPFHPEDVKVHAKRHAVVLKDGTRV